jgi:hypothetical protein
MIKINLRQVLDSDVRIKDFATFNLASETGDAQARTKIEGRYKLI